MKHLNVSFATPNKRRLREPILEVQLGMERLSRRRMAQPIAQVGGVWGNLAATHPGRGCRDGNVLRQVGLAWNLAAWPRSSLCARWECFDVLSWPRRARKTTSSHTTLYSKHSSRANSANKSQASSELKIVRGVSSPCTSNNGPNACRTPKCHNSPYPNVSSLASSKHIPSPALYL
jgi:hypothetical protein